MNFVYPGFLYALFAIAIPIVIHLFNFQRYKKVFFTNVKFLREVKEQTQSKSQLKHLLVLLSRILAITFLVFAFAQPYIPAENKVIDASNKLISVYLDNSFSMDGTNSQGQLFEQAKSKAFEIASSYKPTDRFQLLTNDFEGRHQKSVSQEEFKELIDEVELSPSVKSISEVITRQGDLFSKTNNPGSIGFLISDFQKGNMDHENIQLDSSINTFLIPVIPQQVNNLYIDSCWFESPIRQLKQPDQFWLRIKNTSGKHYDNIPIKLIINNIQKALSSVSIQPNSSEELTMSFTLTESGVKYAVVSLTDFPVTFDDSYFFTFEIKDKLAVLSINDTTASKYLYSLFGKDEQFSFMNTQVQNIDYSQIPNNNLIILNQLKNISSGLGQELAKFVRAGGSIAISPNMELNQESYEVFLSGSLGINHYTRADTQQTQVGKINLQHSLFQDIFDEIPENMDVPNVNFHFAIDNSIVEGREELMTLQNENPFLLKYQMGNGKIYLFSSPISIDASNFIEHALFVPIMYKIAVLSQFASNLFYTIGVDTYLESQMNVSGELTDNAHHLRNYTSDPSELYFDIIPEIRSHGQKTNLFVHNQINKAGHYTLSSEINNEEGYAFNYNREESDLSNYSVEELEELLNSASLINMSVLVESAKNFGFSLSELNEGKKLWKLCIIFALIFLGTEILLLRLWK